jgi:gamma-glutamylcyclotransferase (GGCT)/AIG2-like uncharacterized protein YtfP
MAHHLARHARPLGPAKVLGRLYDIGRFPGMIDPASSAEWVHGELHEITEPDSLLPVLDRYEGCNAENPAAGLFERRLTQCLLETGQSRFCWVYYYLGSVTEENRILSGDYILNRFAR